MTALPLPAGLPLEAPNWEETLLMMRQLIVQLLAVIQQQTARIAALEAHLGQNSRNSDRPPSSDPPYAKRSAKSGIQGRPGAKPGHPGHRQVLLAPTEVIAVDPRACACERSLKAPLPAEYRHGHGPRLTALIGELSGPQRGSRSAVQEFCTSVLGLPISRGAIQRAVDRASEAIRPHYEAIAEQAQRCPRDIEAHGPRGRHTNLLGQNGLESGDRQNSGRLPLHAPPFHPVQTPGLTRQGAWGTRAGRPATRPRMESPHDV